MSTSRKPSSEVIVIDGRYRLDAELGRGGMGVVHRGTQLALDRPVAIKRLLHEIGDDASAIARFRREALTASRLSHPGIVGVLDAGVFEGTPYLVMELVDGEPLDEYVLRRGFLPVYEALVITSQIADALASAHDAGVLHRDVKPANVMLARDGRARLLDFGLATLASSRDTRLTRYGVLVGTPDYLAPEIARGADPDPAGDVYALGASLFELLTGRVPFERATPMATVLAHLGDELVLPSRYVPGISSALDALVGDLMARDPRERVASAHLAKRLLDAAIREAAPEPTAQRVAPPWRSAGVADRRATHARPHTERELDAVLLTALIED